MKYSSLPKEIILAGNNELTPVIIRPRWSDIVLGDFRSYCVLRRGMQSYTELVANSRSSDKRER